MTLARWAGSTTNSPTSPSATWSASGSYDGCTRANPRTSARSRATSTRMRASGGALSELDQRSANSLDVEGLELGRVDRSAYMSTPAVGWTAAMGHASSGQARRALTSAVTTTRKASTRPELGALGVEHRRASSGCCAASATSRRRGGPGRGTPPIIIGHRRSSPRSRRPRRRSRGAPRSRGSLRTIWPAKMPTPASPAASGSPSASQGRRRASRARRTRLPPGRARRAAATTHHARRVSSPPPNTTRRAAANRTVRPELEEREASPRGVGVADSRHAGSISWRVSHTDRRRRVDSLPTCGPTSISSSGSSTKGSPRAIAPAPARAASSATRCGSTSPRASRWSPPRRSTSSRVVGELLWFIAGDTQHAVPARERRHDLGRVGRRRRRPGPGLRPPVALVAGARRRATSTRSSARHRADQGRPRLAPPHRQRLERRRPRRDGAAAVPRVLPVLRRRRPAVVPAVPALGRRVPRRAVQHRLLRAADADGRPGDGPGARRLRAHARRRPPLRQPPRPGARAAHPRAAAAARAAARPVRHRHRRLHDRVDQDRPATTRIRHQGTDRG